MADNLDAFEAEFAAALEESHIAFMNEHGEALKQLMALSKADVDAITPDNQDLLEYEKLIAVVKKASAKNLSNAALANRIRGLGEVAVKIAERIPALAGLI